MKSFLSFDCYISILNDFLSVHNNLKDIYRQVFSVHFSNKKIPLER